MVESYPLFPLAEMQLAEEALAAEVQLLGSALVTEMKLLEGALAVATQPSPFKLENFKLLDGGKLAANCCRIMAHSQHLIQAFICRQLAGEKPFRATAPAGAISSALRRSELARKGAAPCKLGVFASKLAPTAFRLSLWLCCV